MTYPGGISRSSDAVAAHFRHNPKGRAYFPVFFHMLSLLALDGPSRADRRPRASACGKMHCVAATSHAVRGSKVPIESFPRIGRSPRGFRYVKQILFEY